LKSDIFLTVAALSVAVAKSRRSIVIMAAGPAGAEMRSPPNEWARDWFCVRASCTEVVTWSLQFTKMTSQ